MIFISALFVVSLARFLRLERPLNGVDSSSIGGNRLAAITNPGMLTSTSRNKGLGLGDANLLTALDAVKTRKETAAKTGGSPGSTPVHTMDAVLNGIPVSQSVCTAALTCPLLRSGDSRTPDQGC